MASSSNGNLVDEFEEAFQACINALTKQEPSTGIAKDEINFEVDQTTQKFMDVARQMESFFIQKRFLLSALKPEFTLKEENSELRYEIGRKEDLIKRHFDKLEQWKGLLADQQLLIPYYNKSASQTGGGSAGGSGIMGGGGGGSGSGSNVTGGGIGALSSSTSDLRNMNTGGTVGPNINASPQPGQIPLLPMGTSMQQMQAQQHMQQHPQQQQQQQQQPQQHQQQQQQHLMQAQQMQQHMQQIQGQQMFMQQSGSISTRGGFNQGPNVLQGPLAYLEKTTSNIDLVGMGDGRR